MNFADLRELLRVELVRRIESGALTGTRLAQQTGFQQAHISNFLNRKRALSLEGLDRVLAAQNLTVDQILPVDISGAASAPAQDPVEAVPLVSASIVMEQARIPSSAVIETVQISAARLHEVRSRAAPGRAHWQRFVALRVDAQQASAMEPLLSLGAIAVIDRHYNSVAPYRSRQATLCAVRSGSALLLRHVEVDAGHLILRPSSTASPVQLIAISPTETPSTFIIGRVCLTINEL